jgi:hypothetical protein
MTPGRDGGLRVIAVVSNAHPAYGLLMFRGGIAIGGGLITLAIAASPALATTDRVDYSDHANPICASSNAQYEQLYESFEQEEERLYDARTKNRKQARRIQRRLEQLDDGFPFKILAIYQSELNQLKAIAPPPGYEGTVANWLANRQQIVTLYQQYVQIEQQEERGSLNFHKRPSRKAIKRRQKRRENLERMSVQIEEQLLTDAKINLELGSRMGAAYCVTGATGQLPSSVSVSDED